ncbi:MAG: purine/pyrimidine permease [Acidobacteriota bacterium]|nr:purine/pyrimidine permease [Acidobacteriota bacterium]
MPDHGQSSTPEHSTAARPIYGLEDRPGPARSLVLGLQHVLTMFGATVSVPLLFGPAMGLSAADTARLISAVMLCSGLATLLQTTIGSRLPIVQGVSFSFLGAFFLIIGAASAEAAETGVAVGPLAMQYIAGAILAGALVEIAIGYSGLVGFLRRALSPVVIGPVIMLIGLALFMHGAPKAGTHWPISGLTILLIIVFSLVLSRRKRFFRLFPILTAVVGVTVLCYVLSQAGVFPEGHPSHVSLGAVHDSQWVRLAPGELFFPWGLPKFHLGFFLAILAGYLASMIESVGDYHAVSYMSGGGTPTARQLDRGIGSEGIGCFLTGIFGGFASTSYSENIGLIGLTKVGSRWVVQVGGVILVVLGIFGKFGGFAAAIPGPVVGALYCALFGLIAAIGIQQLAKADLSSDRNLFISGFSLFMGLSVPAYFAARASVDALGPGQTLAMYTPTVEGLLAALPATVGGIVAAIGSTGMAVAAVLGILLDNLIPGTPEERGLGR